MILCVCVWGGGCRNRVRGASFVFHRLCVCVGGGGRGGGVKVECVKCQSSFL